MFGSEFRQCRSGQVNRVLRQLWIGHMALLATHGESGTERTASAVLHHIAHQCGARWLADDAPVQALTAFTQALDHCLGAMVGRAFLVAGDEKGDLPLMIRVIGSEALDRDNHRRQAAFHIRGAAPMEHAVLVDTRGERRVLPGLQRAGGDHVGVAGEAQHWALRATYRPEILHILDMHRLDDEAAGGQTLAHQLRAAFIQRGDGWTIDQLAGEFESWRKGRGSHWGSGTAVKGVILSEKTSAGAPQRKEKRAAAGCNRRLDRPYNWRRFFRGAVCLAKISVSAASPVSMARLVSTGWRRRMWRWSALAGSAPGRPRHWRAAGSARAAWSSWRTPASPTPTGRFMRWKVPWASPRWTRWQPASARSIRPVSSMQWLIS